MGIFGEVKRQFIARPDEAKDLIVYKWPDKNIRMFTQLTVQADEKAVFFKEGEIVGVLDSGTHRIDGKDIPFLGAIIDKLTDSNFLLAELYFVSTREFSNFPFGGGLDTLKDSQTELVVSTRLFGEYSLKINDPESLILNLVGTQNLDRNEDISDWVKSQIMKHSRELVSEKVSKKEWNLVGLAQHNSELEKELKPMVNEELTSYGLEIGRFGNINISIDDKDLDMLKKFQRDQLYSKNKGSADAAMKVGIGRGMEKGGSGGTSDGVGLGIGIALGSKMLKDEEK